MKGICAENNMTPDDQQKNLNYAENSDFENLRAKLRKAANVFAANYIGHHENVLLKQPILRSLFASKQLSSCAFSSGLGCRSRIVFSAKFISGPTFVFISLWSPSLFLIVSEK